MELPNPALIVGVLGVPALFVVVIIGVVYLIPSHILDGLWKIGK